ncbi:MULTISPECIES: hypothetical protein [unclassified Streptomyces]|uniref:hypothetical protein n=1 Tax=unclassified Streptomyces TaxID=2593676 RepID=UPI00225621A1|nr:MULTISPECIES: hypothetical protein [unclassified Streptomyces]MCX4554351.1 hypothetical protein [Streptomyces sp. NBC_01500]WSC25058.1 hypothetical protein OIE60_36050 [Streptomyces sp. NBC_01766]
METDGQVVQYLIDGASRSDAALIAAAAAAVHGSAVLVDPLAGPVHSSPRTAAPAGTRAAAAAQDGRPCPQGVTVRRANGATLVLTPGQDISARRTDLVARTTTASSTSAPAAPKNCGPRKCASTPQPHASCSTDTPNSPQQSSAPRPPTPPSHA